MNYNFSNNLNFVQFLAFRPQTPLYDTKYLVSCISDALKRSLAIYQIGFKINQNVPNNTSHSPLTSAQTPSNFEAQNKKPTQKYSKIAQQNKKSIQKLSYNSTIQKNQKEQSSVQQKLTINHQKNINQQQKTPNSQNLNGRKPKNKIIHQNRRKQHYFQHVDGVKRAKSFIDHYQMAYIPANNLSAEQLQQKRQKLLLRKVLNWKQIDKKVGFRKMQLKKLLS